MSHARELVNAIADGMKVACADMLDFSDEPAKQFNAEYLFTVAAAKAINDKNGPAADPYDIRIECSTENFALDCLPLMKRIGKPTERRSTILRTKDHLPTIDRPGRIDIAVYHDPVSPTHFGKVPLCAIELKGFNPPRHLVVQDLQRNLQFHRASGPTGSSVLDLSLFGALHSRSAKRARINEGAVKSLYQKWMIDIGPIPDLHTQIFTFTVSVETLGRIQEEVHETIIDTTAVHHFVGVVVAFDRMNGLMDFSLDQHSRGSVSQSVS